jgi:hypothetical protein
MELGEILTSLNKTKNNLLKNNEQGEKFYVPYVINKCFSYHLDTLFQANFMNQLHFIDKKMQYEYFLESISKKSRFSKWTKPQEEDIEAIMTFYGYSKTRAMEVVKILSKEQLKALKDKTSHGGKQ